MPLPSDYLPVFGFVGYHQPQIIPTTGVTLLITNNAFVKAAASLSLATNALATVLIGYKMWWVLWPFSQPEINSETREHRRLVKNHLSAAGTKSRVLNAFALLIESGSVYCALIVSSVPLSYPPQSPAR